MSAKAIVSDRVTLIERKNRHGFKERVYFTGNLKGKPKGWKVVR